MKSLYLRIGLGGFLKLRLKKVTERGQTSYFPFFPNPKLWLVEPYLPQSQEVQDFDAWGVNPQCFIKAEALKVSVGSMANPGGQRGRGHHASIAGLWTEMTPAFEAGHERVRQVIL